MPETKMTTAEIEQMLPHFSGTTAYFRHWTVALVYTEGVAWLAENAGPDERILDTRGWARFVAGRDDGYDYWHVRQALSDRGLAYVVVGRDELEAKSRRAESLGALLAFAAEPVGDFPAATDGRDSGVRVYRMNQPISWEGFRP